MSSLNTEALGLLFIFSLKYSRLEEVARQMLIEMKHEMRTTSVNLQLSVRLRLLGMPKHKPNRKHVIGSRIPE